MMPLCVWFMFPLGYSTSRALAPERRPRDTVVPPVHGALIRQELKFANF